VRKTGKYYLTVDLGTGNTKVSLISSGGDIIGVESFVNRYRRDDRYEDAQYFLPKEWRDKILKCCRSLCEEHPEIRINAITSAGARQSIVLYDRGGGAFIGLPNIDHRGRAYLGEIPEKEDIYRKTGRWGSGCFPAINLLGYLKKYPGQFASIYKITSVSEWVAEIFTGNLVMEHSQACETQLYDIGRLDWSEELCRRYGLNGQILPPLQNAGTSAGTILPQYRDMLHTSPDAVFVLGGADTQAALVQTGIQPGEVAVVSGTTSPVVSPVGKRLYDEQERVWTDVGLGGAAYLAEMNPGVTGLNYQRLKDTLFPGWPYEQLEAAYQDKKNFCCTASFSSMLFYEKRSLANGGFFLKPPLDAAFDPVDLMWAALADIACSVYEQLWRLCDLTGNRDAYLLGCGGGFQSPSLCQMLADLSGRSLVLSPGFGQATAMGLVSVCNRYFGQTLPGKNETPIEYHPKENQLVHRYYPVWLENRNRANL